MNNPTKDTFYIGQIFVNSYPSEAADFCNNSQASASPCYIKEIDNAEDGSSQFQIVPNDTPDDEMILLSVQDYLSSTDWYVTRQMETGTPIPADVKVKRMAAREKISQLREQLKDQDKGDQ